MYFFWVQVDAFKYVNVKIKKQLMCCLFTLLLILILYKKINKAAVNFNGYIQGVIS